MSTLPPLRTVRTATGVQPATPPPGSGRSFDPVLAVPRLPSIARGQLQELLDAHLLETDKLRDFLMRYTAQLPGLTTRERTVQLLSQAGLLTLFQQDRIIAGQMYGLVLGPYRVLDRISSGTVGTVFRAEHGLLRRRIALKVLAVDNGVPAHVIERFHTEMRLLAALDHPNIVRVFDAGVAIEPNQPALHYLAMELLGSGDLEQQVCENGPQPVEQVCDWGRQVAAGLQAAHDMHLVHRDLKPSNLMLTSDGVVKIVDFGLARELTSTLTVHRDLLGSIEFMAPEQGRDPTAVGPPADVFSLGACLFWMLTGVLPEDRAVKDREHAKQPKTLTIRRLRDIHPDCPAELDSLVGRMLATNPADRPHLIEVMHTLGGMTIQTQEQDHLHATIQQLSSSLRSRDITIQKTQDAVLFAMAKMAETQVGESPGHLKRMQDYVRILAEHLLDHPEWSVLSNPAFLLELVRCVPLHDIGMSRVPDTVFNKPDTLTVDERTLLQQHPIHGCVILDDLAREHGGSLTFLRCARAIVRHHHERWDGTGYPDRLAGHDIPSAARLVALADVYDSLRHGRPHRAGLDHSATVGSMLAMHGHFDPAVRDAFRACEQQFADVAASITN